MAAGQSSRPSWGLGRARARDMPSGRLQWTRLLASLQTISDGNASKSCGKDSLTWCNWAESMSGRLSQGQGGRMGGRFCVL